MEIRLETTFFLKSRSAGIAKIVGSAVVGNENTGKRWKRDYEENISTIKFEAEAETRIQVQDVE